MTAARVLFVVKGLGRGGTERLLASGLRHLNRDRFEAEVAYLLPWKDALVPEIRALNVPVHCLGDGRAGSLVWPLRLRTLVRSCQFDIVHTHMPYPAIVTRLVIGPGSPALVHTEHNVWERYRWATYWANALTYARNDAVLAVSSRVAHSVRPVRILSPIRRPFPPVEVLIHGIDAPATGPSAPARSQARAKLGIVEDETVIGTVGNFTPKKDHGSLLEAFANLRPDHLRLTLVMVGTGPLEMELRAHARGLGIGHRIVWAGSRDDVASLLPAFDVFVLSSRFEGLSIALLEALAAGVPCVATAVGGIPEVVEDGVDALLVPPGDSAALAAAIAKLLADPALRQAYAARGVEAGRRWDLSRAISRIEEVYDQVLGSR